VWDGIWFVVATVTTVGYGDVGAQHVEGRIVAVVVMLSASISSRFSRQLTRIGIRAP
jgi:voltage-gated potassium channel Kch